MSGPNTDDNNTGFIFIHYDGAHPTLSAQQSVPLPSQPHLTQQRAKTTKSKNLENSNRRSANWDRTSTNILIDLYKESLYNIDSSSKQARSDLYKKMTEDFNNHESVTTKRSMKALKRKWEELCNKYKKRMRGSPDELPLQTWEYHDKMSEVISQMPSSELEQLINEDNTAKEDSSSSPQPTFPADGSRKRRHSQSVVHNSPVPQGLTVQQEGPQSTNTIFHVEEPQGHAQVNYQRSREELIAPENIENRQDTLLRMIAESTERQDAMLKLIEQNGERQNALVSTLNTLVSCLVESLESGAKK